MWKEEIGEEGFGEKFIIQEGGFSRKSETVEEGFLVGMVVGNTKIGSV